MLGLSVVLAKGRTLFVADTSVSELPDSHELVEIAIEAGSRGETPWPHAAGRVPVLFHLRQSARGARGEKVREAVRMMDARTDIDFEYEGDMPPEIALDPPRP